MPGKSKHGKGKHPHYKKSKLRQRQAVSGLQQPVAQDVAKPTLPAAASVSPVPKTQKATAPSAVSATIQRSYSLAEIKRIGILTGIILVILIILYFVLH